MSFRSMSGDGGLFSLGPPKRLPSGGQGGNRPDQKVGRGGGGGGGGGGLAVTLQCGVCVAAARWGLKQFTAAAAAAEQQTQSRFLRLCSAMNVVTLLAGLLSVLVNIVIVASDAPPPHHLSGCEVVVRVYGIGFGLLVMVAELEWPASFIQLLACLESWVVRGLFYIFVGSLLECSLGPVPFPPSATLHGLRVTAAYVMVAMGCLYTVLGMLCFRLLKLRQVARLKSRKLMAQEVQQLQAQKHEIERLLQDTECKLQHL